jgi:hypothetical protein
MMKLPKEPEVPFVIERLEKGNMYTVALTGDFPVNLKKFISTRKNMQSLLVQDRPVAVVSPERTLDGSDIEAYRKYFCVKAKADHCNYVYFSVPVSVKKVCAS